MRIAMVSEHASPLAAVGGVDAGGQNVHVEALARALAERGAEVAVHTRRDDPHLPDRVELCPGVRVEHVAAGPATELPKDELLPHMGELADRLAEAWRAERPDVVHAHFWMSGLASLDAARVEVPVVQTFHALGVVKRRYQGARDTSPPNRLELERRILREVDRVIATSSDEVCELARMGGERDRIAVVPCGVDLDRFRPDGPAEERRSGRRRLVYVGRMVERKGVEDIIRALVELPDAELVAAGGPPPGDLGDDPEMRRLAALARRLDVADRVELRGRVAREDVPALIRSADAVVTVPWYEPFGIVPLEAMACGVPVVGSAVGGMLDSIADGETGILVPPRDARRLAEVCDELLADPERRERLGRAGVERARERFDWKRVAEQTLATYADVLGEGASLGSDHIAALAASLPALSAHETSLRIWGAELADRLLAGGRLLVAGNGGSAAEAQHLTAELVGRYREERRPLSAIAIHAETSSLTAIGNDYGFETAFARQVRAHGRKGDVLLCLSTSGRSANLLAAVEAARECGVASWAFTGPGPNPLAGACDSAICLPGDPATVQELELVAIHLLSEGVDRRIADSGGRARAEEVAA